MLQLSVNQYRQIIAHAASASPLEVCGLLAGSNNTVLQVYPIRNVAENPESSFRMEQSEQVCAMLEMDNQCLDLLAIYHSHPPGVPIWPSDTDISDATYPDAISIILAPTADGTWTWGAFELRHGKVIETALLIA
jgi:[CysO sulfur-carrier protein]-S-L-cysteine hydrolase